MSTTPRRCPTQPGTHAKIVRLTKRGVALNGVRGGETGTAACCYREAWQIGSSVKGIRL